MRVEWPQQFHAAQCLSEIWIVSHYNGCLPVPSFPQALCQFARDIVVRLSPLVRRADFAVDWVQVNGGKSLYKQDSVADAVYIVLSGRYAMHPRVRLRGAVCHATCLPNRLIIHFPASPLI
jgi:hypothetical protein